MAEGGGLLNRYRVVKPYRGFESLRLRQSIIKIYALGQGCTTSAPTGAISALDEMAAMSGP